MRDLLLWYAPLYAFFTYPIFGLYGGYLSELFPTEIRATAVTGIYNLGRLVSFFGPYILGWVAGISTITVAIGVTAVLYLLALVPLAILPETIHQRRKEHQLSQERVGWSRRHNGEFESVVLKAELYERLLSRQNIFMKQVTFAFCGEFRPNIGRRLRPPVLKSFDVFFISIVPIPVSCCT